MQVIRARRRATLRCGAISALGALVAVAGLPACDYDPEDIDLGASTDLRDGGPRTPAQPSEGGRDGWTPHEPPPRGMDASGSMDASDGIRPKDAAPASPLDSSDAQGGSTSDTGYDAANSPVSDGGDGDGDTDSGGPEPDQDAGAIDTDPCSDGTFVCTDVPTTVVGDWSVGVTDAVLTAVVDGHTFEARTTDGQAIMTLPTNRSVWVRVEAPDYWRTEIAIFVPRGVDYHGHAYLFSPAAVEAYFGPLGIQVDESRGWVIADFPSNIPGASASLGTTSAPPIVANASGQLVLGDALLPGGGTAISFGNVVPGPFAVMPTAPGHTCLPFSAGLLHVMSPRTVFIIKIACVPSTP